MLFAEKVIIVRSIQVQQQCSGSDCGLFAVANATELCFGSQPGHAIYKQSCMREHLMTCFLTQELLPFPKEKEASKAKPEVLSTTQVQIYCTCRLIEDKRQKMAKCVVCLEWFHARYVQIPKDVFQRKTHYKCPQCSSSC